ncbi:hypothetical protein ACLESO_34345 [Pyxidicoccus sp. 3LG]
MATIHGMPSCIASASALHILYTQADGSVFDDYYDRAAGKWFMQDLSKRVRGTPAATGETFALRTEGQQHALFRDARNHVIHVYYTHDVGWRRDDLTDLARAPEAASDPTALVYDDAMQVFYRDAGNQLARLVWTGSGWRYENLSTTLSGVPAAEGRPSVLAYYGQLHLVFRLSGGDLFHLYKDPKHGWKSDPLMSVAKGARPAAGEPFMMATDKQLHVLYRDTQDAISHVYYANGWRAEVLDEKVEGAPGAKGDPCGLVYGDRMRVFFRAKNDDIYQYYFRGDGKWGITNLNGKVGDGVGAGGDPATLVFAGQNHVVYRDAKGRLADLYSSDDKWQHQVIDDKLFPLPEVGEITLKNEGAFLVSQRFVYFDADGREQTTGATSNPYPVGQRHKAAPSNQGVPDGAEVWVYAQVSIGKGAQAHVPCINRTGSTVTASFTITGTTLDNDIKFDGVSAPQLASGTHG